MSDSPETIPLPQPTALSQPFWDACRDGRLVVQHCADCGEYQFIPQPCCTNCQSKSLEWAASSGRGTVYSYSVVHRAPRPQFETPYAVIIVAMEEGWHMLSNLLDCPPENIAIDMPVVVSFRRMSEEITLPLFRACGYGENLT